MQSLLTATIEILVTVSLVYFFIGFMLTVTTAYDRKKFVSVVILPSFEDTDLCETTKEFITVTVMSLPATRQEICKLAHSLGLSRPWNRKTVEIKEELRAYGYV